MLDDLARYNKERWEDLARANIMYSRPVLDLDADSARKMVDPEGMMCDPAEREVLCLAGGGGQQSAAFALLGARVTVLDLCETQLARDQEAAQHYGVEVRTVQGDMRDLSRFPQDSFDIVWHAHSINFVPDAPRVIREVARVVRPDGLYRLSCHNPFSHGLIEEHWTDAGYPLSQPYVDGKVAYDDPCWDVEDEAGNVRRIEGPHEFRHKLSTLVNALCGCGFIILGAWEGPEGDANADPGSWDHYKAVIPPYLTFWSAFRPGA